MSLRIALLAATIAAVSAPVVQAAADYTQLGNSLTAIGAEKAGNADGSIPAYSGGMKTPPATYKSGSGNYPDPYAGEKPVRSIDATNMDGVVDKLTEGTRALMKQYPSFRIDVYPTHRSVWFPQYVLDNTLKKAGKPRLSEDGLALLDAHAQVAFPIPQDGYQAMWNHVTRMSYLATLQSAKAYNVDGAGTKFMSSDLKCNWENPFWNPALDANSPSRQARCFYQGPARRVGEATLVMDPLDFKNNGRRAWQYLPGQRRVRLAPDLAFDTPNPGTAGVQTFDDVSLFNGSLERYDWKLLGKKEIYVPYNAYRAVFQSTPDELIGPKHFNPDLLRWELHRVWVVEATLKPGMRHVYKKRRFYLDEDSWAAVATENYDSRDTLYKAGFALQAPLYDKGGTFTDPVVFYDLISGAYSINVLPFATGSVKSVDPLPSREWASDSLAGAGVR